MRWTLTVACERNDVLRPYAMRRASVHPMHQKMTDVLAVAAHAHHAHSAVASTPGRVHSPRRLLPARLFYTPRGAGRHHRALAGALRTRTTQLVGRYVGSGERTGSECHVHVRQAQAARFES